MKVALCTIIILGPFVTVAISTSECRNQPADIGFLLDESRSVGLSNFQKNIDFISNFIEVFDIGDDAVKVSVFAFNTNMGDGFHFKCCNTTDSITSGLNIIRYKGLGQDFEMALSFARSTMFQSINGVRSFSLKILIFFTDGQSPVQDGGKLLHELGVIVYAVGVGNFVNKSQLENIATNSSYVFMVDSYNNLVGHISQDIRSKACSDILSNPCERNPQPCKNQATCIPKGGARYVCLCPVGFTGHNCETDIDYCIGVVCHNGGTCKDGLEDFTCQCPDYFTGTLCEIDLCKPYPSDVVFVLDSSNSVETKYFNIIVDYIKSLTAQWEISPSLFQVAVVSYSKDGYIELPFDRSMDKSKFDEEVSKLTPRGGPSEIHRGLNLAYNLLRNNNRHISNLPLRKYIILLSDGLPSTPSTIPSLSAYNSETLAVAVGEDVSHHFLSRITGDVRKIFPYNTDSLWNYLMNDLIDTRCRACQISHEADVLFAVDVSSGLCNHDLTVSVPTILMKILAKVKLGTSDTMVSLLTFDMLTTIRLVFKDYQESRRLDLERQLAYFVQSSDFGTNITDLIWNVKNVIFDSRTGARTASKKVLIIVSGFAYTLTTEELSIVDNLKTNKVEVFTIGFYPTENFDTMSSIASTSFHVGINGDLDVLSIDKFISTLVEQLHTITCTL